MSRQRGLAPPILQENAAHSPPDRGQYPQENRFATPPNFKQALMSHQQNQKLQYLLLGAGHRYGKPQRTSCQAIKVQLTAHPKMDLEFFKAIRPISIARLHGLLRFHLRPIDDVVYIGSSRGLNPTGCLFLGGASRLDAFSVYPVRTWLLHVAPGGTMDTPAVRPTRSSRTRVSFLQTSNARTG